MISRIKVFLYSYQYKTLYNSKIQISCTHTGESIFVQYPDHKINPNKPMDYIIYPKQFIIYFYCDGITNDNLTILSNIFDNDPNIIKIFFYANDDTIRNYAHRSKPTFRRDIHTIPPIKKISFVCDIQAWDNITLGMGG